MALDENVDEWYDGDSLLEETGVVNIDVNDSYAHAWIEIYLEGYGFVPFEMTPPDEDEADNAAAFDDLFSGLFRFRFNIAELPEPGTTNNTENQNRLSEFFSMRFNFGKFLLPLGIAVGALLLALTGYLTVQRIRTLLRLKKLYQSGKFSELVYIKYSDFVRFLQSDSSTKTANANPLPQDVLAQCKRLLSGKNENYTDASLEQLFTYIEQALYSPDSGSREEYDRFAESIVHMRKTLKKMK